MNLPFKQRLYNVAAHKLKIKLKDNTLLSKALVITLLFYTLAPTMDDFAPQSFVKLNKRFIEFLLAEVQKYSSINQ